MMTKLNLKLTPRNLLKDIQPGDLNNIKVTFINMPLRETAMPNVPPQGPLLLAARLRQYGAQPTVIDLNGYRIKDEKASEKKLAGGRLISYAEAFQILKKHFEKYADQDIVAFSGMITTLRWQEKVAKMVRKLQPNCFLVSGGGLATEIKEGLFNWIGELDAVARSEGDDVMLVMAKDVKTLKDKGASIALSDLSPYCIGEWQGKFRFKYEGDRPMHLDVLPFAEWDLLRSDVYGHDVLEDYILAPVWGSAAKNSSATPFTMKRSLTTVSSRGCPYACTFCYRGAQGERNYGMRSAENLAKEARHMMDTYKIDFLGFPDDNFAVDRRRIVKLPEVFKEFEIRWGTHTRLDEADDRLKDMAKSGCVYIGFGAESASEPVLTRMKKGGFILKRGLTHANGFDFPTTMVDGIRNCRDVGIHANCTWIMAYPGETLLNLKTSVAFILWQQSLMTEGLMPGTVEYDQQLASVNKSLFVATAYPGTDMFKEPVVREKLEQNFGIKFDKSLDPICDESFRRYVLELDDATKVMRDKEGKLLNYSDMSDVTFSRIREHVDSGQLEKILEL